MNRALEAMFGPIEELKALIDFAKELVDHKLGRFIFEFRVTIRQAELNLGLLCHVSRDGHPRAGLHPRRGDAVSLLLR